MIPTLICGKVFLWMGGVFKNTNYSLGKKIHHLYGACITKQNASMSPCWNRSCGRKDALRRLDVRFFLYPKSLFELFGGVLSM